MCIVQHSAKKLGITELELFERVFARANRTGHVQAYRHFADTGSLPQATSNAWFQSICIDVMTDKDTLGVRIKARSKLATS